jgi:hypothetical protein
VGVVDGPIVRAGRDVGQAPRLVGHDADDTVVLFGDAEVLRLAGRGVVGEDVAARVVGALLALHRVALLGAAVDLPAGPDVVARVDLGLGGEAGRPGADDLVDVEYQAGLARLRVELQKVGIDAVLCRADVEPAVVALDDGEVAALLVGVLRGQLVGVSQEPAARRLREGRRRREGAGEKRANPDPFHLPNSSFSRRWRVRRAGNEEGERHPAHLLPDPGGQPSAPYSAAMQ